MPQELSRAFEYGIAIDASAIAGFGDENHSDLFLHPEADTLTPLPWRPEHGSVVRMFCHITYPNGKIFECDTRSILKNAIQKAKLSGHQFFFGAEQEFYLFMLADNGNPTKKPYDNATYIDMEAVPWFVFQWFRAEISTKAIPLGDCFYNRLKRHGVVCGGQRIRIAKINLVLSWSFFMM